MIRRRHAIRALLVLALIAAPAAAVIPQSAKIADAIAAANDASGRAVPLWCEVTLSVGDEGPVATGVLASHPTGLARLELYRLPEKAPLPRATETGSNGMDDLIESRISRPTERSTRGSVERHLLQGNTYRASSDGRILSRPNPYLPPLFLLQASSGAALQAALSSFGVSSDEAELALLEDRECYVLGGRLAKSEEDAGARRRPSMWVDHRSFEVRRIDGGGVSVTLGPMSMFDGVTAPSWITIEVPDRPVARLDVNRVAPANAPAAAFAVEWLTAPPSSPTR